MYSQNSFYYPQPQTLYNNYQVQQQPGLKGRPVSSFEEARAITIDFDGSTFFFPDLANKRIYTKQINMDGTASLFVYEIKEQPIEQPKSTVADYITRAEFEQVIQELRAARPETIQPAAKQPESPRAQVENGLSKLF